MTGLHLLLFPQVEREAKYVFPLDETCAVCGFEAYIGSKRIIGEIKRKEVARLGLRLNLLFLVKIINMSFTFSLPTK